MHQSIKKLQEKPEHIKKSILIIALVVCMSLVSLVWFLSLNDRLDKEKTALKSREDIKPFVMFSESVSSTIKNISASVIKAPSIEDKLLETQMEIDNQN